MNFKPQHFPIGTTFRVNTFNPEEAATVFTVKSVVCNGINSYCLNTGEYYKEIGVEKGWNLVHVKEIVKRGDGPTVIRNANTLLRINRSFGQSGFHSDDSRRNGRRQTWDHVFLPIRYEIERRGFCIWQFDTDALQSALLSQTWVRVVMIKRGFQNEPEPFKSFGLDRSTGGVIDGLEFDQKRFRAWMNRNLNRFLFTAKKLEEIDQEIERQNNEWEDERRDLDPVFPGGLGDNFDDSYSSDGSDFDSRDYDQLYDLTERRERQARIASQRVQWDSVVAGEVHWDNPMSNVTVYEGYAPFRTLAWKWFDDLVYAMLEEGLFEMFSRGHLETRTSENYFIETQFGRSTTILFYVPYKPFTLEVTVNEMLHKDGSHGLPDVVLNPHFAVKLSQYESLGSVVYSGMNYSGGSCSRDESVLDAKPHLEVNQSVMMDAAHLGECIRKWYATHIELHLADDFVSNHHYLRASRYLFKDKLPERLQNDEAEWLTLNTAKKSNDETSIGVKVKRVRRPGTVPLADFPMPGFESHNLE